MLIQTDKGVCNMLQQHMQTKAKASSMTTIIRGTDILQIDDKKLDRILNQILEWINEESSFLLPQDKKKLLSQIKKGLSIIILVNNEIAGHATAWELTTDTYEIGTVIVGNKFRRQGFTHKLFTEILLLLPGKIVLCTSTNEYCVQGAETIGMKQVSFDSLPPTTRQETCCCSPAKMKAPCFQECKLKDIVCKLLTNNSP